MSKSYLGFQASLANQAPQNLPSFLEIQQAHILLCQGCQLVLVCRKAPVNQGNHGPLLRQRMDTTKWTEQLFNESI